jgi:histone deacetylase 1/2
MIACSSTEAKYKALADNIVEIIWLQYLLSDLQITSSSVPTLWCDNLGATYLPTNPIFHARTKHVEVDYHFVRDKVAKKEIHVHFISSQYQLVNVFTKSFLTASFTAFQFNIWVDSSPSSWGGIL